MTEIPAGYMMDSKQRLVPEEHVSDYDKLRDKIVRELVERALEMQRLLVKFKNESMGDVESFVELSNERYGVKLGGTKGNVSLTTYDGAYMVKLAVQDRVIFDERIQGAKEIVDECIHRWSEGSRSEIKALVEHAFQVDKEGKLSVERILSLTRITIDDERWNQGMRAIKDSMTTTGSQSYLRLYQRNENGRYDNISLDISKL